MIFYRRLPVIKAMTFDLDDTLYDNHPVIAFLETSIRQWMIEHHPVSQRRSSDWWQNLKKELVNQQPLLIHDVTQWRFCQIKTGLMVLGYSEFQANQAAMAGMEEVLRLRNLVSVPNATHQVLGQLAASFPLIAITNGNANPDKIGLGHYFQAVFQAGKDGFSKPFPDLFMKAQQSLAIPCRHILHVGDHARTDVYGAKSNGFSACWLNQTDLNIRETPDMTWLPDVEIHRIDELLEWT